MVPTICWSRNCLVWKYSLFHLCCQHINRNIGTSTVLSCNRTYWGKCCQQLFEGTCKRTLSRNYHLLTHPCLWGKSPIFGTPVETQEYLDFLFTVPSGSGTESSHADGAILCPKMHFAMLRSPTTAPRRGGLSCTGSHNSHGILLCVCSRPLPPTTHVSHVTDKTPFLPWSFRSWNHVVCHTNIHHDDRSSPLQVLNQHTVTVLN